jgi:hypothetical protein
MNQNEYRNIAMLGNIFYMIGWRKEDREELIVEFGLTDEQVDFLCFVLAYLEKKEKGDKNE